MRLARVPLFERDRELAASREMTEKAAAGTGGLVVVRGAPGIGTTGLLRAANAIAQECGLRVLTARGGELEEGFAFGGAVSCSDRRSLGAPG